MRDLRQIRPGEEEDVAMMLADAFLDGPVASWLIPRRPIRFQVYVPYFRIFVNHVAKNGIIHVTDDLSAAALWLDMYNNTEPDEVEDYDRLLSKACGRWTKRFIQLDETFAQVHPHQPHWYLMFLGVRPDIQGRGTGSALMQHMFAQIDGAPVYLEASNLQNRRLYQRHRFTTLGSEVQLPESGPPIWPMWRPEGA